MIKNKKNDPYILARNFYAHHISGDLHAVITNSHRNKHSNKTVPKKSKFGGKNSTFSFFQKEIKGKII